MSFNTQETHYDVLGVSETATNAEIKKAYRQLSLLHHPDRNPGKTDVSGKFQKINGAYETIGEESKRREYDLERTSPFGSLGGGQTIDEIIANLFFGGGAKHGTNNPHSMFQQMPHGFPPGMQGFAPGIKIFRNGSQMSFQHQQEKPSPIAKTVTISMEQVLNGGTIPVEIERWLIENNNKIFETEVLYVQIPKGVDDNEIIVLKDKGNVINDDCKGDIKIFIKVENTSMFKRHGLDLIVEKHITLKEALCGFSFELKYINGKTYTINNASGSIIKPDFKKFIPGMGLERDGHKGGIIIAFCIDFPDRLDEQVIAKLSELL
jgi:DnaJ-class molecular chaperone